MVENQKVIKFSLARVCLVKWFMCCTSKIVLSLSFSGWISSLTGLNKSIPVGIMMIIIAALFTASAVISLVMFKKVSDILFPSFVSCV